MVKEIPRESSRNFPHFCLNYGLHDPRTHIGKRDQLYVIEQCYLACHGFKYGGNSSNEGGTINCFCTNEDQQ